MKKTISMMITIVLAILLIINIYNFVQYDSKQSMSIKLDNISHESDHSILVADYLYTTNKVNNIHFAFEYSDEHESYHEPLGTYPLNTSMKINNWNPFYLLNKMTGNHNDEGKLQLFVERGDDHIIYISCSSSHQKSIPITLSQKSLLKNSHFDEYDFEIVTEKNKYKDNFYTLLKGTNDKNHSKIEVYFYFD